MLSIVPLRGEWAPVPLAAVPYVVLLAPVTGLLPLSLYHRALRGRRRLATTT